MLYRENQCVINVYKEKLSGTEVCVVICSGSILCLSGISLNVHLLIFSIIFIIQLFLSLNLLDKSATSTVYTLF